MTNVRSLYYKLRKIFENRSKACDKSSYRKLLMRSLNLEGLYSLKPFIKV